MAGQGRVRGQETGNYRHPRPRASIKNIEYGIGATPGQLAADVLRLLTPPSILIPKPFVASDLNLEKNIFFVSFKFKCFSYVSKKTNLSEVVKNLNLSPSLVLVLLEIFQY